MKLAIDTQTPQLFPDLTRMLMKLVIDPQTLQLPDLAKWLIEFAIVPQTPQVDLKRTMMKLLIYTQVVKVFLFNYDYGVKSSLWICFVV
jgi:hypothetical protein